MLSTKDITVKKLLDDGTKAIFIGIGLPQAKVAPVFDGLTEEHGFYTSKDFLPRVAGGSKKGMCSCAAAVPLPALNGTIKISEDLSISLKKIKFFIGKVM
jgi:dihydropyrimidine dehydrogenase (NADP+)